MPNETPAHPASTKAEKRAQEAAPAQGKPPPRPTLEELRTGGTAPAWMHAAAAALHDWAHDSAPKRFDPVDYAKALDAARYPGPDGNYVPHLPACSARLREQLESAAKAKAEADAVAKKRAEIRARRAS